MQCTYISRTYRYGFLIYYSIYFQFLVQFLVIELIPPAPQQKERVELSLLVIPFSGAQGIIDVGVIEIQNYHPTQETLPGFN